MNSPESGTILVYNLQGTVSLGDHLRG